MNARQQFYAAYRQLRTGGFGEQSMPMDQEAYDCKCNRDRFDALAFTRRAGRIAEKQESKRGGFWIK